ncbi:MAG: hypothetical protein ACP5IE_08060, partial [Infirmifilum sp.]
QRIEAFSEILSIREAFKDRIKNGEYVMTPYFVNRLAYWSKELGLSGEEANWLALKHEDLLEDTISVIVRAVRGEKIKDGQLMNTLSVWTDYKKEDYKKKISINSEVNAVEHIFKEYGSRIKQEIAGNKGVVDPKSHCWNALIFTLGIVRGEHLLQAFLKAYMKRDDKEKLDLAEPVKNALDFLNNSRSECKALNLLLADRELTPLSERFLLLPLRAEEFVDNPFLDVLIQHDEMRNELEVILKRWEDGHRAYNIEEIYALGLSILSAYANVDFADEALRAAAPWGISSITHLDHVVDHVVSAVEVLSLLRGKSPDHWADVLSYAANILTNNKEALLSIGKFIINSFNDFDKLGNPGKVELIRAFTRLISRAVPSDVVCKIVEYLLKKAEGFNSELLRYISEADVLHALAHIQLDCGIDLAGEIKGLISNLDRAEKFDEWFNDGNVKGFLRKSLEQSKEDLVSFIKNTLSSLYSAAGEISQYGGKFDDAVEYFEKARSLDQEIRDWINYVISYGNVVSVKSLKADTLKGLVEVAGELKEVFDEAMEKLEVDALSNWLKGSVLADYLFYLRLSGNKGEAEKLLEKHGRLLDYLPLDERVATMLFLNHLGVVKDRPGIDELLDAAVAAGVYKFMVPALKLSLGLEVDCGKGCGELYKGNPSEELALCEKVCDMLHLALEGKST